jgi:hypothetical protein
VLGPDDFDLSAIGPVSGGTPEPPVKAKQAPGLVSATQ